MISVRIWRLTVSVYKFGVWGLMMSWGRRGNGEPQTIILSLPKYR